MLFPLTSAVFRRLKYFAISPGGKKLSLDCFPPLGTHFPLVALGGGGQAWSTPSAAHWGKPGGGVGGRTGILLVAPGGGGGKGPGSPKPTGAGDNGVAGAQLLIAEPDVPDGGEPPGGEDKSCGGGNCRAEPLAGITALPPDVFPAEAGTRRVAEAGLAGTVPLLMRESELRGAEVGAVEAAAGPGGSVGVPGKPIAGGDVEEISWPGPRERHASHSGVRHPVVISRNKLPKHAAMPSRRGGCPRVQAGHPWPLTRHPWPMMEFPPCLGLRPESKANHPRRPRLRRVEGP